MAINSFDGVNRFLSNFHPCNIEFDGDEYSSVEHAYQAAKTVNSKERNPFQSWGILSAAEAKRKGRTLSLRPDWEEVKVPLMSDLLRKKFGIGYLRLMLLATGDEELIEGNWWGDTFWGVCNGKGENQLGKLLMQIRKELRN